jgi:hypothetical protein
VVVPVVGSIDTPACGAGVLVNEYSTGLLPSVFAVAL